MVREHLTIVIRIERTAANNHMVSVRAPGGDATGQLALPAETPFFQEALRRIALLDTDDALLRRFGETLFEALFTPAIRMVYARTQGMCTHDQALRLVFDLDPNDPAIVGLPWEYLVDPDQGPLVMLNTTITRYLALAAPVPPLGAPLPVRALLTGASTPPSVDIPAELRTIERAMRETLGDSSSIVVEPHLTRTRLQRRMREGFHVWHFIGHGGVARDAITSVIWLEDETGDPDPVGAAELAVLLKRCGLRLAVLNACAGGAVRTAPFQHIALALLRVDIPAVLAMQSSISTDVARAFATEFYQTLAEGAPIDACVTEGRKAILGVAGLDRPDWGIPVIYSRAGDGRLFELPPPAPPRASFEPATALIPAGTSLMGSAPGLDVPEYETPQHPVTLPAFRISTLPVSNREYVAFIRDTGRLVRPEMLWNGQSPPPDLLDLPVAGVSFADAAAYCAWLSVQTKRSYRLPHEAEWERAMTSAAEFGITWGQLPEWTCTLWGERPRRPDTVFAYPWRDDDRNTMNVAAHSRRVIRGLHDANGAWRITARSSAQAEQIGLPGGRYGFRVVQIMS